MKRWLVALLCGFVTMASSGVSLADEAKEPEGKALFLKFRCNSCHTIDAVGIAKKVAAEDKAEGAEKAAPAEAAAPKKKPPDLSSVGLDVKADWMAKFLMKKETSKAGKKHMKLFRGSEAELQTIVAWLETMKAEKSDKPAGNAAAGEKAEKVEASGQTESDGKAEAAEKTESTEKAEPAKAEPATETK